MDQGRFDEFTRAVAGSVAGLPIAQPGRQQRGGWEPGQLDRRAARGGFTSTRRHALRLLAALPLVGGWADRLEREAVARRRAPRGTQPEVVGGHPVPQGTFPFMAHLENTLYACGGSVIAPGFVLTAAHCTGPDGGFDPPFPAEDYVVDIGEVNLGRLGPANAFGVTAVYRHPGWDPATSQAFDVAVLQLDRPVPPGIGAPVAFVGSGDARFDGAGQAVEVAGWGHTSSGGSSSPILLGADLNVVSDPDCADAYGDSFDEASMICAAFPGRDSCQGDSGGPLFANEIVGFRIEKRKGKKRRGKKQKVKKVRVPIFAQTQVGIVSFGQGCADPSFPGVYARVSDPEINDFITGIVG